MTPKLAIRTDMRRFVLDRIVDVSGTSGTGCVAEGVQFSDGSAVLRWKRDPASHVIYANMDDLLAIHGHDGATVVRWVDDVPRRIRDE